MNSPLSPSFNPGGIKDKFDNRDYQWSEIGASALPFDWKAGYDVEKELQDALGDPSFRVPIKNQNGSFSCGGQAWSYLAEILEALNTKSFEERSAKYIYAQTWVPGGGSAGRTNSEIFRKQGVAREVTLPSYDDGNPPGEAFMERSVDITDPIRQDAKLDRSTSYANVRIDIDLLAQAMRDNHGVILLVEGSNNASWYNTYPVPPSATDTKWFHWVLACKTRVVGGTKYLGFLNSWGTAAGEHGVQFLSQEYIENHALQAWTHVYNPSPPAQFTHDFLVNLNYGDNSSEVSNLQKALQVGGFFPSSVPPTGYYGEITRRAVLAFQIKYAVAPMSELNALQGKSVGAKTRGQLNTLFNT